MSAGTSPRPVMSFVLYSPISVLRCGLRSALVLALGLTLSACAGAPAGPLPPSDPALLTFAEELGVDLADFEKTESGLYIQDQIPGVGATAQRESRVWIFYVGYLPDGTVFDAQLQGDPFQFRMGGSEVIRGWNEGIRGMKVGGQRRLVVPPRLAYGSRGRGDVPPGATLVFDLQLIDAN